MSSLSTSTASGALAQFPAPLQCLFVPKRYKVLYGGRGSGKSWGVARALLLLGAQRKMSVLCVRELQKSIEDSVHKLLSNQIEALGLQGFYKVEKAKIIGANGTEFSFEGIRNNVDAIRSYEGIDVCWAEEAASISKNSWSVLIPTIRKTGSEIWVVFNPMLETDDTYKRFVLDPDLVRIDGERRFAAPITCPIYESTRMFSVKMSWRDNPWFSEELRQEMETDKKRNFDDYLHVWEGHTVQNLQGAIYAKELRQTTLEGRIMRVPYERTVPVSTYWDLGKSDATAIWFIQYVGMQWRILAYYENSFQDIEHYLKELQDRRYVYDTMWLPHDAAHERLGMKYSIEQQVRNAGYRVRIVKKGPRANGIAAVRAVFPNCWFDEEQCSEGLNALRHYRYEVGQDGRIGSEPKHDWASNGSDAFRTFAMTRSVPRAATDESPGTKSLRERIAERLRVQSSGSSWMA